MQARAKRGVNVYYYGTRSKNRRHTRMRCGRGGVYGRSSSHQGELGSIVDAQNALLDVQRGHRTSKSLAYVQQVGRTSRLPVS